MDKIDRKMYLLMHNMRAYIPEEYEKKINNVLEILPSKKCEKNRLKFLKISLATICCSFMLVSSVVFAKDIENYFRSLFANSTEAIDNATQNGYVQNVNMDYVYDKNIGIKVENLILDDLNLDISFCYEMQKENLDGVRLEQYRIVNEQGDLIYEYESADKASVGLAHSMTWSLQPVKLTDTTFTDSVLFGLRQKQNNFNELKFEIKSVKLIYADNTSEMVSGNWNFNVAISEQMKKSDNLYYRFLGANKYVESCTGTLSATGMVVELNFAFALDIEQWENFEWTAPDFFCLKNKDKTFAISAWELKSDLTKLVLHYDNVGKFFDNIDEFELYVKPYDCIIVLNKVSV